MRLLDNGTQGRVVDPLRAALRLAPVAASTLLHDAIPRVAPAMADATSRPSSTPPW